VESATPILGARNIKISKIMRSFFENETTTKGKETEDLRDSFAHLATVEYHTVCTCRIRMGDLGVATNDYFRRKESHKFREGGFFNLEPQCFSAITFRNRVFTAPDVSGIWGK
jgi:hypothetical protein